jgi:hypothetical protein
VPRGLSRLVHIIIYQYPHVAAEKITEDFFKLSSINILKLAIARKHSIENAFDREKQELLCYRENTFYREKREHRKEHIRQREERTYSTERRDTFYRKT